MYSVSPQALQCRQLGRVLLVVFSAKSHPCAFHRCHPFLHMDQLSPHMIKHDASSFLLVLFEPVGSRSRTNGAWQMAIASASRVIRLRDSVQMQQDTGHLLHLFFTACPYPTTDDLTCSGVYSKTSIPCSRAARRITPLACATSMAVFWLL